MFYNCYYYLVFTVLEKAGIDPSSVYISVVSALLNSVFQILKLKLESKAVDEPFFQYCSQCLMARISWIPYKHKIVSYLSNTHDNNEPKRICYNIKHSICCGMMDSFEPKVTFDFSSMTIRQLIAIIKLPSKHQTKHSQALRKDKRMTDQMVVMTSLSSPHIGGTEDDYNYDDDERKQSALYIDFGKSLRLVNFEDLVSLLETCLAHNIVVSGFDSYKILCWR